MGRKETIFGIKCHIKLRGIAKEIWIQSTDLSKGVVELYKNKQDLPSNAKARVDRGHVIVQKNFLKTQKDILEKQKDHPGVESASAAVTKRFLHHRVKQIRSESEKMLGWCLTAQVYIVVINKILSSPTKQRHLVRKQILDSLQPPKYVMSNLDLVHFTGLLTGITS